MISSEEGLGILRKWNRERTTLVLFAVEFSDFASKNAVKIQSVEALRLVVERDGSPEDARAFDLKGAFFDKADELGEIPSGVPFSATQPSGDTQNRPCVDT
jgi:hypothetical protein